MKTRLPMNFFNMLCAVWLGLGLLSGTKAFAQNAVQAWVQRYNGPTDSDDRVARKSVVDSSGNTIVAGRTSAGVSDYDWLVIKYSSSGVPAWTNRYNGPANSFDKANAVAVDGSGNVYVTGASVQSASSSNDFTTIAYSGAGVPLWTNAFNGLGNYDDGANAVAVGSSGNVFVTGSSTGSGSGYDYTTIAYSGAGVPLWTNIYNGPFGSGHDQALSLAVDGSGTVLVTGQSIGSGGDYDYATVANPGQACRCGQFATMGQVVALT